MFRHASFLLLSGAVVLASGGPLLAQGYGGTVPDILVRGDSLLAQNRANEAIVQFQEVRTLCPTPAEIVSSLMGEGRAHFAIKEFLPAAGLFEEAAQRFPDDPRLADILYLAGTSRRQGGDLKGAVPLLEKALQSNPTPDMQPIVTYQLAQSLRLSAQPDKAAALLADFETRFPLHQLIPGALYMRAIAQHDTGDLEGSEKAYRALIEGYPRSQAANEALYEMGVVLAERGKRVEAGEFFRRYSNGNPSSPLAARALERAADMVLLRSPKDAALYYGVAQVKSQSNPTPPTADLAVTRWLGTKRAVASAFSNVWVVGGVVVVLIVAVAGLGWLLARRRRRAQAALAA